MPNGDDGNAMNHGCQYGLFSMRECPLDTWTPQMPGWVMTTNVESNMIRVQWDIASPIFMGWGGEAVCTGYKDEFECHAS